MPVNDSEEYSTGGITRCLQQWRNGDEAALAQLTTEVYRELRRLAASVMGYQSTPLTIQPTILVHELYFQLPGVRQFDWQSRAHFLNVAAKMMRNILVDHARKRQAGKRGGGLTMVPVEAASDDPHLNMDLLTVHEALDRFASDYPRHALVVELRFFGGLSAEETCDVLKLTGFESSLRTVERDWAFSRAWLEHALRNC
jgi:RNA polymerase sigma-70 factor, ECF subfamily